MERSGIRERLAESGLTIHVTGDGLYLHHIEKRNHLGAGGRDVRYLITGGPEHVGDRPCPSSVRPLVDDDGVTWLVGFNAGDPVCWKQRQGERWSIYG